MNHLLTLTASPLLLLLLCAGPTSSDQVSPFGFFNISNLVPVQGESGSAQVYAYNTGETTSMNFSV